MSAALSTLTSFRRCLRAQKNGSMITKSERYREILAVLARQGIGIVDDELIKHEAGEKARPSIFAARAKNLGPCPSN